MWQARTKTLLGHEAIARLSTSQVLVAGVGGVGGYAAEILARTGLGHLTLVDADNVAESNINRQIIATQSSVGESKVELFARRFRDINPDIEVTPIQLYIEHDNVSVLLADGYDFIIDAIDTVTPKIALVTYALKNNIPIISAMGAGGRIDPTKVTYCDISMTRDDGLARVVRQRLRKAGLLKKLTVVASTEPPRRQAVISLQEANKRSSFGTIASIPAIFGIYLANHVILKLTGLQTGR